MTAARRRSPARIASARPGTRSTITTVGTELGARRLGRPARPPGARARTRVRCAAAASCCDSVAGTRSAVRRPQRQRDREQRAALGRLAERDLAAVQLDELAHDRQPEAGAGAGRAPSPSSPERKRPNTRVALLGRHAGAGVGDLERRAAVARGAACSGRRRRPARGGSRWRAGWRRSRLTRSTSKRAGERRRAPRRRARSRGRRPAASNCSATVRTARGEVGVDQRQPRLAVVGLTCSSMSSICSSASSAASRMPWRLGSGRSSPRLARSSCSARVSTTCSGARRSCESSAEQPLAVVVDAREPVGQRRQLGVLARDPLLARLRSVIGRPSATMNATRPSRAAQRPQQQVDGLGHGAAAAHHQLDVEAREAARRRPSSTARRRSACTSSECRHHGVVHSGRPIDLGAVEAAGDQRRVG